MWQIYHIAGIFREGIFTHPSFITCQNFILMLASSWEVLSNDFVQDDYRWLCCHTSQFCHETSWITPCCLSRHLLRS